MDQQLLFILLNRIATALGELVQLKEDELHEAAGGLWYLTPEGEQWRADRKKDGHSLYPIPRQYLTKEQPAPESPAYKIGAHQWKR